MRRAVGIEAVLGLKGSSAGSTFSFRPSLLTDGLTLRNAMTASPGWASTNAMPSAGGRFASPLLQAENFFGSWQKATPFSATAW